MVNVSESCKSSDYGLVCVSVSSFWVKGLQDPCSFLGNGVVGSILPFVSDPQKK